MHDGANSINTDFRDTPAGNWGAAGRVEYKAMGVWSDYKDFSAINNKQDLLVFGAGADITEGDGSRTLRTTADAQWELDGRVALYAAAFANQGTNRSDEDRFDWGGIGQLGYAFTKQWEGFGRYSLVRLDNDFAAGQDVFQEVTLGVNYFLGKHGAHGHRAVITVDLNYLPQGVPTDLTGLGYLASPGEEQFVLRPVQFAAVITKTSRKWRR